MSMQKNVYLFLVLLLVTSTAFGRDLWVDRNSLGGVCSDQRTADEIAVTTPWCTLALAGINAAPGDTVTVRAGVYSEIQSCEACDDKAVLQVITSGTPAKPIKFQAQPDERVIITGIGRAATGIRITRRDDEVPELRYIEIGGFEVRNFDFGNCVHLDRVSDIKLTGLDVHRCFGGAVEMQRTDRVTLESSFIHDNILANFTSPVDLLECGQGNEIRGNFIWNNLDDDPREFEGHGIIMDLCQPGSSTLIENNVVWRNEGWCIVAFKSGGGTIRNNTCWHNGDGRPDTGEISLLSLPDEGHKVYNNILMPDFNRLALLIREREDFPVDLSKTNADGNLIWAPAHEITMGWSTNTYTSVKEYQSTNTFGWGDNALEADPQLVNPAAADFRLSVGSPAIDSALPAQAAALDVLRQARPVDGDGDESAVADRGAFEAPSSTTGLEPLTGPASEDDSDADGMDDAWEQQNFDNLEQSGIDDYDNDGNLDLNEFLSGTNPAEGVEPGESYLLWVDGDSLGGACSDELSRAEVSKSKPWCTLGKAGNNARAGDVVHVRAATYSDLQTCGSCRGNAVLQPINSGSEQAPIRFQAEPGETPIIRGTTEARNGIMVVRLPTGARPKFIEIEGFEITNFEPYEGRKGNCLIVEDTSDVRISRMDIHNCNSSAVELHVTDRVTVEYSQVYDNNLAGYTSAIDLYKCGSGNVIRGNRIWNNTDEDENETEGHGIVEDICGDRGGALIENNVIWDNEGWCIVAYQSDSLTIRNNTCWHNGNGREQTGEIVVLGQNHKIYNNILLPRDGRLGLHIRERSDYPVDLSQTAADGNLIWSPSHTTTVGWSTDIYTDVAGYKSTNTFGWGDSALAEDPKLADVAGTIFSLTAGSPAIDSAVAAQTPALDVDGNVRPIDGDDNGEAIGDRGAFEFGSAPPASNGMFNDGFE